MLKLMLLLHLLAAIFAIGPLAHAVTTASRGLRQVDVGALRTSSRMAKLYAAASVLVVIFGMGLMSQKRRGKELASFGDTWIWLSLVLWIVGVVITFLVITPSLDKAADEISGELSGPEERPASGLSSDQPLREARIETRGPADLSAYTARVAASGGVVAVLFVVIIVLMVYRPG